MSMFLIALEAWRRGVTVNFFTIDNPDNKLLIRYSLSYQGREHRFESSRGDLLTDEAFQIAEDKHETKRYLKKSDVNVPEGHKINANQISEEELLQIAKDLGFPLVLKPTNENAGNGVFSNIITDKDLTEIYQYLTHSLGYKELVIEKHIEGTEHRILVVDGKAVGVIKRVPANIIGDGNNSIKQLIQSKNKNKKAIQSLLRKRLKSIKK